MVRSGLQIKNFTLMKKLLAVSFVGFAFLGTGASPASAWWLWDHLTGHGCCPKVVYRQYNAFSPFCCEGPGGPGMYGNGLNGGPACSFAGDEGYLGELPAPTTMGGAVPHDAPMPSANSGTPTPPPPPAAAPQARAFPPAVPPQMPAPWMPGLMNPAGVPGAYPGFPGYGANYGYGMPSAAPGFVNPNSFNGLGR